MVTDGVIGAAPGDRYMAPGASSGRHLDDTRPRRSEGRNGAGFLVLPERLGLELGSIETLVEFPAEPLDRVFVDRVAVR